MADTKLEKIGRGQIEESRDAMLRSLDLGKGELLGIF